ncbi:MAG TPA: hypothetical protein P5571_12045 [Candidatus Krumholzibacteria bacterium]|nr:hypothetical protein [Candidatus Krumholzibacteria bacterium]HRX52090.1 hypothetical protein [Candidatus Krumholzibacteria bacterium]
MTRSLPRPLRIVFGLLALWLALWPTGDAVTGSSLVKVLPAAAPVTQGGCCGMSAAAGPGSCCGHAGMDCRCLFLGGLVFHTAGLVSVEPDPITGPTVSPADVHGPTRERRPLVPPPLPSC